MKETIRVLLSEEEVDRRIKEVADQINRDYAGKEVHLICCGPARRFWWSQRIRSTF